VIPATIPSIAALYRRPLLKTFRLDDDLWHVFGGGTSLVVYDGPTGSAFRASRIATAGESEAAWKRRSAMLSPYLAEAGITEEAAPEPKPAAKEFDVEEIIEGTPTEDAKVLGADDIPDVPWLANAIGAATGTAQGRVWDE
jgi:hypothetical protein